jgi:predicted RNase H-like nuclease
MKWVAGVDGCKGGWFVVLQELGSGRIHHALKRTFAEVLGMNERPRIIAVDIPVGLLDRARPGGRLCDREARNKVGLRRPSVFSPPVRKALKAASWREADTINRASSPDAVGLARQTWGIVPKILEVDKALRPPDQQTVRECFPELSFAEMAGGPMRASKRTVNGMQDRVEALVHAGFADPRRLHGVLPSSEVSFHDVLDAHACCWTAARIFDGTAGHLPAGADVPKDKRGLAMQIWY